MKNNLFFLFLFYSSTFLAQEANTQEKNSLYYSKLLDKAFEYNDIGKPNESIKLSSEVLEYANKEGVDSLKSEAYNVIAKAFYVLKDSDESLNNLIKARDIYLKLKDNKKLSIMYNNIGLLYEEKNKIDSAIVCYKKGIKIARNENHKGSIALLLYNLGSNYSIYRKDYKKALSYFNEALTYTKYSNHKNIEGFIYVSIGYVKKELKAYDAALENLNKGIKACEKNGDLYDLIEIYDYKIEIYKKQNKLRLANIYLLKQIKIKDSLDVIEKEDLAKEIGARYIQKKDEEKLQFIEKEKEVQQKLLSKSTLFNWVLAFFIVVLFYTAYWIYTKNKELKKARDRAFGLSKVKSDFYSEISHELRTPLYAIIELSSLLLKEHVNVRDKKYLESLNFSGTHLLSLINNVLQLNKVESGELKIETSAFNLKVLIANIIDTLEYGLKESGNTIKLNFDNLIPQKMIGDSLKLSQVLINLLSNSIKFTKNDIIELMINRIKTDEQTGDVVVFFKISDGALAASKEKQLQVFDDYYHKHSNNENNYKDTGLGLSVVKSSLEVMDSNINMSNEEGGRSSFYFTVRFEEIKDTDNEEGTYQKKLDIIKDYKLLIVDDNKINQLVTKKILDQLNVFSEVADSGEKAIALVKANHYDCVLMDLQMPKIDGYEATRRIRLFNKDIAIIALTAATSEEVESKIKKVEMNGSILKPFMINDFVGAIVRGVQKK